MTLGLRPVMWSFKGAAINHDNPFNFQVVGLPPGREGWVCGLARGWKWLRCVDGEHGQWVGNYATRDEAITMLLCRQ